MKKETQNLIQRPPVVVVMGHIDHGKTTLLDYIRKSNVAQKESGGITQHIGAYQIEVDKSTSSTERSEAGDERSSATPFAGAREIEKDGRKITFIDTPGHEAFSAMRARGAKVADIAILVIDSCDGVQAQTKEAILQIKLAKIPIIVALNKIDKPEANPEKVKRELQKEDILVESLGGKIPSVLVSAKTGQGVSDLLELILLLSEMEGLKADILKPAEGSVVESYLDSQRGPIATLIVSSGVLKIGDVIGTSSTFGKIKKLENFQGEPKDSAFPADPIVVLGFEKTPKVGENFKVFSDIETAQNSILIPEKRETIETINVSPEQKVLNLILKVDCLGSMEAIEEVLRALPQDKVVLRILKSEVGEIGESDIKFAKAYPTTGYPALILGFRVKIKPQVQSLAEREKIKTMTFEIIYDLVEGIRKFMEKILESEVARIDLGKVKVLAIFLAEKNRIILGGKVIEGEVKKGTQIEVSREEEIIGKGKLVNLQKNKKDVERAGKGEECGILYEGDSKTEVGDVLVIYTEERKKGEL